MPYGTKPRRDGTGTVDFNALYFGAVEPAGLACYRGDESELGGIIHRSIFRLVGNSDVMIADLTTWNPNTLSERGLRHALRRRAIIIIGADWQPIPYNVTQLTRIPYRLAGEKPSREECRS